MGNVIINASLCEPPKSDLLMFRYLTQVIKDKFNYSVLLETEKEMVDLYFHFLTKRGLFDYISDILPKVTKEQGIRIDYEFITYPTIKVKSINWGNVNNLLFNIMLVR